MSTPPSQDQEKQSGHLHETKQPLSAEGQSSASAIGRAVQQEDIDLPAVLREVPSIAALPPAQAEQQHCLREHVEVARRFLQVLRDRLGLHVAPESAWLYALPLRTASVQKLWSETLVEADAYAPVDPVQLYADQEPWLDDLGDVLYDSCIAHIGVKSGIIDQYGIGMAHQFRAKARAADLMTRLWHQNSLGPLLFGPSANGKQTDQQMQRLHAWALKRLLAVVYLEHGLQFVHELCGKFFNPADLLGTDIVSLIDYEPPRTTLQNLAQMQRIALPAYSEPSMIGPAHAQEFSCTVTLGKSLRAEGKGTSHRAAASAAAAAALAEAARHPQWSKALEQRRQQAMQDARKGHYPLFPDAKLSPEAQERVRAAYRRRYHVDIEPSLGFAACVDQETKKYMKLAYCHETMAWYGSSLLEVVRRGAERGERVVTTSQFWIALGKLMGIQDLRTDLGISAGWDGRDGQWTQTVQAIVSAVFFSNPYEKFLSWLQPLVTQIESALRAQDAGGRPASLLKSLVAEFDSTRVYTSVLQEAVQAQAKELPLYGPDQPSKGRKLKLGDPVQVSASWGGVTVYAQDKNKRLARNRAAFMLLKTLVEQNRLS